jgi:RNA polymerase sigma-70 factor (sigma-E family)
VDAAEFEAFVVGRSAALLRFGHMVSADRHGAEDLVQGALAAAFRHRRRLDAAGVESYVRRSIVNAQATRWRRLLRREQRVADVPDWPASDGPGQVDDRLWAVQALRALPARQRAVVVLRYLYDLDTKAIAGELGISEGTVKSQTAKALATLRSSAREQEEATR